MGLSFLGMKWSVWNFTQKILSSRCMTLPNFVKFCSAAAEKWVIEMCPHFFGHPVLSENKWHYCTVEKEALALRAFVWSSIGTSTCLLGKPFMLYSDQHALQQVLGSSTPVESAQNEHVHMLARAVVCLWFHERIPAWPVSYMHARHTHRQKCHTCVRIPPFS